MWFLRTSQTILIDDIRLPPSAAAFRCTEHLIAASNDMKHYKVRIINSTAGADAAVRVLIESAEGAKEATVNQRVKPPLPQNFISLGVFQFEPGKPAVITIGGKPANGNVHADAVQLLPQP